MPSVCHSVSLPFIWSLVGDEEREKDQTPRKKKSTRPKETSPRCLSDPSTRNEPGTENEICQMTETGKHQMTVQEVNR